MKKTKRIGSIIIAIALLMLSTVSSFAATTEEDVLDNTFKMYQIFKADSIDNQYLTNVQWGSAFEDETDADDFLEVLQNKADFIVDGVNIFKNCETANEVAAVLDQYDDNTDVVKAFAKYATSSRYVINYELVKNDDEVTEAGYYLFVDATKSGAANATIIKMVANGIVNIEVKTSVPQLEKKVMENSYDVNYESKTLGAQTDNGFEGIEYGVGYNDVADYNIGDAVPFRLYGTMASTMESFKEYYYAFVDTLSPGLTYSTTNKRQTKISLYDLNENGVYECVNEDIRDYFYIDSTVNADGTTKITMVCEDILAIDGITPTSIIVVDYEAKLNEKAVVGYYGNENEAYIEYSNNPNYPTDSEGNPNTDKTEEDKVIVFTYTLDGTKVNTDGTALAGAEFYLINADGEYFAGEYYAEKNCWIGDWVKYEEDATPVKSDENGKFIVAGLDEGEYTLKEHKAPEGYDKLKETISFEIVATILPDIDDEAAQNWVSNAELALDGFAANMTSNKENAGSITADETTLTANLEVINTKPYDLPGTGGMGTTLIYIVGGAFVLAALALIVVKRRAN